MKGISVIVPVYNTAGELSACVDSILAQTLRPLEVILVDDGSTDGSSVICEEYAARYPQFVRVYHQMNMGSSAARNRGIDAARGDVLSFIDSDDYINADMFETLLDLMERQDADMAACEMMLEKPDGRSYCRVKEDVSFCWDTRQALVELNSYRYLHVSFCNALFRRKVIGDLHFTAGMRCEDYDLLYRVVARCEKVAYGSAPLYHYVQRPASNSRTTDISLAPMEISLRQLTFFREHFPDIAYAAETDCAFSHMGIYTAYIRNGVTCPPELLKKLRKETECHLPALLDNDRIPIIKKMQALAFCFLPPLYRAVIGRTEHR